MISRNVTLGNAIYWHNVIVKEFNIELNKLLSENGLSKRESARYLSMSTRRLNTILKNNWDLGVLEMVSISLKIGKIPTIKLREPTCMTQSQTNEGQRL